MACCAFAIVLLSAVLGTWDKLRARLNWLLGAAPPKPNRAVAWEIGMAEVPAAVPSSFRKRSLQAGFAAIAALGLGILFFHDHGAHAHHDTAWALDDLCLGIAQAAASPAAGAGLGE
mgnify:CR=1 FL=1